MPSGDWRTSALNPTNFQVQLAVLFLCWLTIVWFHWGNDGIWFQGDSPRHALNGTLFLDLAKDGISYPIEYVHQYYARYPSINPQRYPPLFYVLLALSFALFGISGIVAKCLVQFFALLLAVYTLIGIRRWIAPEAGIVAGLVLLMPGIMRWSGAVMLNLPALTLGIACLFHLRIALEQTNTRRDSKHLCIAIVFAALSILIHPTVGVIIPAGGLWLLIDRRWRLFLNLKVFAVLCCCVLVCGSVYFVLYRLSAAQFSQAAVSKARVASVIWPHFYLQVLPRLVGIWALPVAFVGFICSFKVAQFRRDSVRLAIATFLTLSFLQCIWAKDERYLLWACPAATWLIAHAFVAARNIERFVRNKQLGWAISAGGLLTLTTYLIGINHNNQTKSVNGFSQVANHIIKIAAGEPILYHGAYDGTFIFYTRSMDERLRQQVVLVRKLPMWKEQSVEKNVLHWIRSKSKDDAINEEWLSQQISQTGCNWLLLEEKSEFEKDHLTDTIKQLAKKNEYELVKVFKVDMKTSKRKVQLYRSRADENGDDVCPVPATPMAIDGRIYQPVRSRCF